VIRRTLESLLRARATRHPVLLVTGPRQSGKTTLCRSVFRDRPYVSLEAPDERSFAAHDPRGFLRRFPDGAVLDEIQRVPQLLSYLQAIVDDAPRRFGRFILTGSQNVVLLSKVSQTLAGRISLLTLLPFSLEELASAKLAGSELWPTLFTGGYPRIHDVGLPPHEWLADYFATYVERDVREILAMHDLSAFETFVQLCAGRTAQLVNLSGLGADAGISQPTARAWLSVLLTSYVVWRLPPWHSSLTSRLVKSPKLHFVDSGLLCWLLGIRSADQLRVHPLRGDVFESFVFSEVLKWRVHRGLAPDLYFLRDRKGREIDLLLADAAGACAIEVKSTETPPPDVLAAIGAAEELVRRTPRAPVRRVVVYGGTISQERSEGEIVSWRDLARPERFVGSSAAPRRRAARALGPRKR
jgi:hypothetical protein